MTKYPTNRVRGRKPHGGGMNKLEAAYAEVIEGRKLAGEIAWWAYEPITLRLAKRTGYTPDFAVLLADGLMQFHRGEIVLGGRCEGEDQSGGEAVLDVRLCGRASQTEEGRWRVERGNIRHVTRENQK